MPSFLARLRGRSKSLATPELATEAPTTKESSHTRSFDATPAQDSSGKVLNRPIHPDINALLASAEEAQGSGAWDAGEGQIHEEPTERLDEVKKRHRASRISALTEETDTADGFEPEHEISDGTRLHHPYLSGDPWSTFGRQGEHHRPDIGDFGERVPSRQSRAETSENDSSVHYGRWIRSRAEEASKPSSVQSHNTVTHSAMPSNSQQATFPSTPDRSGSKPPSRQSSGQWSNQPPYASKNISTPTISSESHAHSVPHRLPSHVTSSLAPITTPSGRESRFDSPRTFGYPTPAQASASTPAFDTSSAPASPSVPPLPPWSTAAFDRNRVDTQSTPARHDRRERSTSFASNNLFPSLPFTFGRSSRGASARTRATHLFTSRPPEKHGSTPSSTMPPVTSTPLRRRGSAQWSAQQASDGVAAGTNKNFGWPADVSREIVLQQSGLSTSQPLAPSSATTMTTSKLGRTAKSGPRSEPRASHVFSTSGLVEESANRLFPSSPRPIPPFSPSPSSTTNPPFPPSESSENQLRRETKPGSTPSHSFANTGEGVRRSRSLGDSMASSGNGQVETRTQQRRRKSSGTGRTTSRNKQLRDALAQINSQDIAVDLAGSIRPQTPPLRSPSDGAPAAGPSSLLQTPSLGVTAPTPQASPGRSKPDERDTGADGLQIPGTTTPPKTQKARGKRKAEESDDSPPKSGQKTTFAVQDHRRPRVSDSSHTPSSFAPSSFLSFSSRKRARIVSPMTSPDQSRPPSSQANHGSWSRSSSRAHGKSLSSRQESHRAVSFASSAGGAGVGIGSLAGSGAPRRPDASRSGNLRRTNSQGSIPLSAIMSPRPASVDRLSSFHMRDPRKPPPLRDVGWSLRLRNYDEEASPLQAWCFFIGFLFPPVWWFGALSRPPKTRVVGGADEEKAITVDDPQIERDALTWRTRCRIMSIVFLFTYLPFIILVAIFVPRS